jgi:hypothetical protein
MLQADSTMPSTHRPLPRGCAPHRSFPRRAQFDDLRGPTGALLIGDAKTVAKEILYVQEVLGFISRVTLQNRYLDTSAPKMLDAIDILGSCSRDPFGQTSLYL